MLPRVAAALFRPGNGLVRLRDEVALVGALDRDLLVGTFDFVFAVVAIFPLFILGLTHDLVSSERERGTLTPLLTAPISFDRILIAGRLARAEVTVAAAVSLASGAIALACAAPSEGTTSPPEGIRRLDAA